MSSLRPCDLVGSVRALVALRALVLAQSRRAVIRFSIVTERGTIDLPASVRSAALIWRAPSENAANIASGTSAAISDPVNPSHLSATALSAIVAGSILNWFSAARRISTRSLTFGRSTKNTSSKRPLRKSSGGNALTSFAVAITNASDLRSCIQESKVPSASDDTPPSAAP